MIEPSRPRNCEATQIFSSQFYYQMTSLQNFKIGSVLVVLLWVLIPGAQAQLDRTKGVTNICHGQRETIGQWTSQGYPIVISTSAHICCTDCEMWGLSLSGAANQYNDRIRFWLATAQVDEATTAQKCAQFAADSAALGWGNVFAFLDPQEQVLRDSLGIDPFSGEKTNCSHSYYVINPDGYWMPHTSLSGAVLYALSVTQRTTSRNPAIQNGFSLELYPNPVEQRLNWSLESQTQLQPNQHLTLQVFDMAGQLVMQQVQTHTHGELDLTGLAKGRYQLKLVSATLPPNLGCAFVKVRD
jgi:hypothetical protein